MKSGGTCAAVFRGSPLDVVGKTGAAENGDGRENSIVWFVGWVEDQEEPIVVVTTIEVASGGKVTAPAVRRVLGQYHSTPDSDKEGDTGSAAAGPEANRYPSVG